MEQTPRAVTWEALEHHHLEKGNDWYFILLIVVLSVAIVAIIFGNLLLAFLVFVSGVSVAIAVAKGPAMLEYAVTVRGVRIGERLYPYPTLLSYHIDEENPHGPQLLIRSERKLMPLIILPIPIDQIDDIEYLLRERLEEEELAEPFFIKLLEVIGL
jgi:hypothetical protein